MSLQFFLFIVFNGCVLFSHAQYEEVFKYLKPVKSFPNEKNLPVNDELRCVLMALADSKLDTTVILENLAGYDEARASGDTMYDTYTPIDSNIHILDVNGDKTDDIIFHFNNWAFGLQFAYIFMKDGKKYTALELPGTIFMEASWKKSKLTHVVMADPACCTYPFHHLNVCTIKKEKVIVNRAYHIYTYSWAHLKNCTKGVYLKAPVKTLTLLNDKARPDEKNKFHPFISETNDTQMKNTIEMKEGGYYLLDTFEEYKFILFKGTNAVADNKNCAYNYYCGWTKDL